MESALSDVHWLARSLKEPTAFELIFDRHFDAIYGYVHRRVGRDLADELAAETFTVAFERRSSCRASGSVLPWLTIRASRSARGEGQPRSAATSPSARPSCSSRPTG
jgi:RNA polymerase sigma-70 factor (ECF subfamily)